MNQNRASILIAFSIALSLSFSSSLISAQEKKNEITISGIIIHYQGAGYKIDYNGYYKFPIDPGIELLYFRRLSKSFSFGTGFNFQKGRIASSNIFLSRFKFEEISIPLIFTKDFTFNSKSGLCLSTGLYSGKILLLNAEHEGHLDYWDKWDDLKYIPNYSNDVLFIDVYFSTGFFYTFSKRNKLSLNPFFKYRVNRTWFNDYEKKFHYGIKLSYTICI
jgi:hypothetical protein